MRPLDSLKDPMNNKKNFRQDWENVRLKASQIATTTAHLARRGEKSLRKLSLKGKWHLDITAIQLQKDHLYYLVGKEFLKSRKKKTSATLDKYVREYQRIDKIYYELLKKLKES